MPIPPRPPSRLSAGLPGGGSGRFTAPDGRQAERSFELKSMVHQKLLNSLNIDQIKLLSKERVRVEIGAAVESLLLQENIPMNLQERDHMIEEILDDVFEIGRASCRERV